MYSNHRFRALNALHPQYLHREKNITRRNQKLPPPLVCQHCIVFNNSIPIILHPSQLHAIYHWLMSTYQSTSNTKSTRRYPLKLQDSWTIDFPLAHDGTFTENLHNCRAHFHFHASPTSLLPGQGIAQILSPRLDVHGIK